MLSVGFTGPCTNTKSTQDVLDASTADGVGMVAEETRGRASITDDILKSVDELLVGLHTKHVEDMRGTTTVDGGGGRAIVNGRGVRVDHISEEVFVATRDIECGVRGLVVASHSVVKGDTSILCGLLKSTSDNFSRKKGKELS